MFPMWLMLIVATMIVLGVSRDPRRLWIGVALLFFLGLAGLHLAVLLLNTPLASIDIHDLPLRVWLVVLAMILSLIGTLIVGIALIINGLTLLRAEGVAVAHLLSLAVGLVIIVFFAVGVWIVYAQQSLAFLFLMFLSLPVAWLGYGLVAYVLYAKIYRFCVEQWGGPVEAIIVLGAGVPDGTVRPLLASRIESGIRWYHRQRHAGQSVVLVMSGGQGPDEPLSEAAAMSQWAINQGIDPAAILQEDQSTTTRENLDFSARLLHQQGITGRVAVVTSDYHAFRAATLMRTLNIPGYALGAKTARYYVPSAAIREYIALLRDHRTLNLVVLSGLSLPFVGGGLLYLLTA